LNTDADDKEFDADEWLCPDCRKKLGKKGPT
jgi:hypothetical protein